jgi:hypothetical protein
MVVHPLDAEDGFGDVAVASAVHPPVNRLQHVAGAAALLGGQAGVGGNRATEPGAQQPGDGVQPIRAILVEWNQGGERLIGGGWGKPEQLKPVAVAKVDMEMQAEFVRSPFVDRQRLEMAGPVKQDGRGGDQQDDGGVVGRRPEDWRVDGARAGSDREIATPNRSATSPCRDCGVAGTPASGHGHGGQSGSACCVAAIPRRVRLRRWRRCNHSVPQPAIVRCLESLSSPHPTPHISVPARTVWRAKPRVEESAA